jgi:excisionase family DNA binding protein
MKPIVNFDKNLIKIASEYYQIDIKEHLKVRLRICGFFSNPDMENHSCNFTFNQCSHCDKRPSGDCEVSCNLQEVCMAAYAYRKGIGGDNTIDAINYILKHISPKDLVKLIYEVDNPPRENPFKKREVEFDNYLTISEAAKVKGCKYINVYSNVVSGKIPHIRSKRGRVKIRKADIYAWRFKKRKNKARKS